jgi:hypothetical protein
MKLKRKRTLREHFERYWKTAYHGRSYKRSVWLERDDIWQSGGYAQPVTNSEWNAFQAGYRARVRDERRKP